MRGRTTIRIGYLALAAFILLSPAVTQIFGHENKWIRSWRMFKGVGVGMLRGEFVVMRGDEEAARETPLAFFGLERWPAGDHYWFVDRVLEEGDLERIAAPRCAELAPGETLAFHGFVGSFGGWVRIRADDLCGATR